MRIKNPQNPRLVPKTDELGTTKSKSLDKLVKLVYKVAKSLTKTSSKVYEPLTYNKVMNDLIHENKQKKTINKKF